MTLTAPTRPGERWSMDFVSDHLANGRRFRILTSVDCCSRKSPGVLVDTSIGGERIVRFLDDLCLDSGFPEMIEIDNGPEFISNALDRWAYQRGVKLHFIRPGKPTDNAFIESTTTTNGGRTARSATSRRTNTSESFDGRKCWLSFGGQVILRGALRGASQGARRRAGVGGPRPGRPARSEDSEDRKKRAAEDRTAHDGHDKPGETTATRKMAKNHTLVVTGPGSEWCLAVPRTGGCQLPVMI